MSAPKLVLRPVLRRRRAPGHRVEPVEELVHGLRPVVGILGQGLEQHLVEFRRQRRVEPPGRRHRLRHGRRQALGGGVAPVHGPARDHVEEQRGQAVHVAARVHRYPPRLLRGHVPRGTPGGPLPEQGEVGEVGGSVGVDQHVAGFDVAVDDAHLVGGMDGAGDVVDDPPRRVQIERAPRHQVPDGAAREEAHDQIDEIAPAPHLVDGDEPAVAGRRHRRGLVGQPGDEVGSGVDLRVQSLERDKALRGQVGGPVDGRAGALADPVADAIVPERAAGKVIQ